MKEILSSKNFLISTFLISVLYLISITYLMNFQLVKDTLVGDHAFTYRVSLLVALLGGMWTAMSGMGLVTLVITAFLTGANLTLVWQRIMILKSSDNLQLVAGGSSLFGIVGSGCAACSLPIISLLGLTGSLVFLPYRGMELSYLAVIILLVSLLLLMKTQQEVCNINLKGVKA